MKLRLRATGTTDYLQNQHVISKKEAKGIKESKSLAKAAKDPEETAKEVVYQDKNGCYIPQKHFIGAIRNASGKLIKKGRTTWRSDFEWGVEIEESNIRFIPPKKSWDDIDNKDGRRPPRTGGRVIIHRPLFKKGWKVEFTLIVDEITIPRNILDEVVLKIAGHKSAIGDHRPEYGHFKIEVIKEIK